MDTSGSVVHEETGGLPIQPPDEMVIDDPPMAVAEAQAQPAESKDTAATAAAAATKKSATTIKIPSIVMNAGSMGEVSNLASPPAEPEGKLPSISIPKTISPNQTSLPSISPMVSATSPTGSMAMAGASIAHPPQTAGTNQNQSKGHPQLNDALAYLDRVKAEFHDQPEVYNKFLQIMRDFKVNAYQLPFFKFNLFFSIDSNGVIYRLVHLFMGHKALIEGFNAFLPKSHHIDPMVAETGVLPPHIIAAAMHSGITQTLPPHPQMLGKMPAGAGPMSASTAQQTINLSHYVNTGNMPSSWSHEQGPPQPHPSQGYYTSGPMPGYTQPPPPSAPPAQQRAPIESFRGPAAVPPPPPQAIAPGGGEKKASPQFNKAFGYVKKIKQRFQNDPETYKAFLAALHSYHKEQLSIHEVYETVSQLFRDNPDLLAEFMQFLPEQDAAAIITRSSSRSMEGNGPALGRFGDIELKSKRAAAVNVSKAVKRARQATAMLSSYPSTAGYVATHRSPDESAFFDRVKTFLGSRAVYAEFLKCLNLFSQDILKLDDLLRLVNGFIGGSEELYGWFKKYIGLKEPTTQAAVAPSAGEGPNWRGTAAGITSEIPELNLASCRRIGSYRVYPKTHRLVKASGRTALCEEVLNDAMLSCPTFTSEDSTFVGSKKNAYEEALFKCEDERYELDLLIEHNLATIAVFEPLVRRMESMTLEERNALQLGPTLGGTSEVIYRKALRRIYGDKVEEIIGGIRRTPSVALPVVLARLKQKDEEWRRLQRDWNRVWRDVHLKNYYKALDHQGIEFKAADRRNFAVRALIAELEGVQAEQQKLRARDRLVGKEPASSLPNHVELTLKDGSADRLLEDLVRLVRVHLRNTAGLSSTDRKAVLEFFATFVPEFFAWRRAPAGSADSLVPSRSLDDPEASEPEDEAASMEVEVDTVGEVNPGLPPARLSPTADATSPRLLFANSTLFAFLRLVQMALERLDKARSAAQNGSASSAPFSKEKRNIVAAFLDLETREQFPDLGRDAYRSLLMLLKKLIEGELEPAVFEEQTRFMLGNEAYAMYTFDKLLQAIIKQAQTVLMDPVCEQLIRLFDSWKEGSSSKPTTITMASSGKSGKQLSEYSLRLAAENVIAGSPKESLVRIEYVPKLARIGFQLQERLFDSAGGSAEAKWSSYVDGFVKLDTNPAYLNSKSKVFLKRYENQLCSFYLSVIETCAARRTR